VHKWTINDITIGLSVCLFVHMFLPRNNWCQLSLTLWWCTKCYLANLVLAYVGQIWLKYIEFY
jgi:hypothetical protein